VLERCGRIDPERIEEYLDHGGYRGLERACREMSSTDIIDEIKRSELQGRGGAGFPAGLKWSLVAEARASERWVVCNADEGDPGAFTDRALLEGDPHAVIEGLVIAGRAVGASKGLVFVRAEYGLASQRLAIAIGQARAAGYLGPDVLGSGFSFDLSIVPGAGAYVCGEETALLGSLEGRRAMPRPRPPYPALRGFRAAPTLIQNVETFANIPRILSDGAGEFCRVGTALSRGTKTFALTGRVANRGLIEVPLGTTMRQIVEDIGGGMVDGGRFKAALIGGPGGGWLSAAELDTPIDFPSLRRLGLPMGSGGLMALDHRTCLVRVTRELVGFSVEASCGKCPPCRIGTKVMLELLDRILAGEGLDDDLDRLRRVGEHVQRTSLCGLGQQAPNPVLSGLTRFREEFEAHVKHRRCPAGRCPGLSAGDPED
jgi:NADH:ubiquinone oxidoreductase subunit F (NADH-binding)